MFTANLGGISLAIAVRYKIHCKPPSKKNIFLRISLQIQNCTQVKDIEISEVIEFFFEFSSRSSILVAANLAPNVDSIPNKEATS